MEGVFECVFVVEDGGVVGDDVVDDVFFYVVDDVGNDFV